MFEFFSLKAEIKCYKYFFSQNTLPLSKFDFVDLLFQQHV